MTPKTVRIKNDLPHLLAALCAHPDCPEELKDAVWDTINDRPKRPTYSVKYWESVFESYVEPLDHSSENGERVLQGGVQ